MDLLLCLTVAVCFLTCCHGLELTLQRSLPDGSETRSPCGVLTCTQTIAGSTNTKGKSEKSESTVSFKNISGLYVFQTPSSNTELVGGEAVSEREVLITMVTQKYPIVERVANGMNIAGSLVADTATVRVELVKLSDCNAQFSCSVRGLSIDGHDAVSKSSVVQHQVQGHTGHNLESPGSNPGAALQLLTLLQGSITQTMSSLEEKIENLQDSSEGRILDRIGQRQADLERRVADRLDSFENRVEDKIDNNNNLNKLMELDVKVTTALEKFRADTKSEITNSLDSLRKQVQGDQKQTLRNISESFGETLNKTSDLLVSVGRNFDSVKSYIEMNVINTRNQTERLLTKLTSGEAVSQRLHDGILSLNTSLIASLKDAETGTQKCSTLTRSDFRGLLGELAVKISNDLHELKNYILPKTCAKGMRPVSLTYSVMEYSNTGVEFPILCDTVKDGGGWIIIQRRSTGHTDFDRNWSDYKYGFGSFDDDFWLGNEKIFAITSQGTYELRVDMEYKGRKAFAQYQPFSIGDERDKYRLNLGRYRGSASDSFNQHNNSMFSTPETDNDNHSSKNCAVSHRGGWWFHKCDSVNLNGNWGKKREKGLEWDGFSSGDSLTFTQMKIRHL